MQLADDIAARQGLEPPWVRSAIAKAQLLPVVVRLMQPAPAGTPKNWSAYRGRFIDPVRIRAGTRFWRDNRAALERAEQAVAIAERIKG